jgi:hypothetical protein
MNEMQTPVLIRRAIGQVSRLITLILAALRRYTNAHLF